MTAPYQPDMSPLGKARRRWTRLRHRRPAPRAPDRGWISFTFDDAPASSLHTGAPLLEARGLRGTWYLSAGLFGADSHLGRFVTPTEAAEVAARGHEIGCHTFGHLDCARTPVADLVDDVERNAAALAGAGPLATFAYPFGDVSPAAKRALGRRFALLRTASAGLVRGGSDLAQAPSTGLQGPDGEAAALRGVARAAEARAWLILFTHDVQEQATAWGCTPGALARVADAAVAAGLEVVTVAEGARRLGAAA